MTRITNDSVFIVYRTEKKPPNINTRLSAQAVVIGEMQEVLYPKVIAELSKHLNAIVAHVFVSMSTSENSIYSLSSLFCL